tara:strand:+ start:585 stop:1304 length:720 start_codon:yes stop_codon:yes gene_type:complete
MKQYYKNNNEKKLFIKEMFDEISPRYNLLNRVLSFGIDVYWRNRFIKHLNIADNNKILDVATGTGDIVRHIISKNNVTIVGIDISDQMIKLAKNNIKSNKSSLEWQVGDAENLPYLDKSFDIITISFGFRNFTNYDKALSEFNRVLKDGGKLGILEFSKPNHFFVSKVFNFYFHSILPRVASIFSKNYAYKYLPESVENFISRNQICSKMESAGFKSISCQDLSFGISTIFIGNKINEK